MRAQVSTAVPDTDPALSRATRFCRDHDLRVPILMAPMAGACPPALAIAVGNAGGMGAAGVLPMRPDDIRRWAGDVRSATDAAFQLNTWIPDPAPPRDGAHEAAVRDFLAGWGPAVAADAADAPGAAAGQSAARARAAPAGQIVERLWRDAQRWLPHGPAHGPAPRGLP